MQIAVAYGVLNWLLFEATLTFTGNTDYSASSWAFIVAFGIVFATLIIPPYLVAWNILKSRWSILLHATYLIVTCMNVSIIRGFWTDQNVDDLSYLGLYLGFAFSAIAVMVLALIVRVFSKPVQK